MIDIELNRPIAVHTDGTAGPYVLVPLEQLGPVTAVLKRHALHFSVAKDAIELDGKPTIAIIDFGVSADARQIQQALDAA